MPKNFTKRKHLRLFAKGGISFNLKSYEDFSMPGGYRMFAYTGYFVSFERSLVQEDMEPPKVFLRRAKNYFRGYTAFKLPDGRTNVAEGGEIDEVTAEMVDRRLIPWGRQITPMDGRESRLVFTTLAYAFGLTPEEVYKILWNRGLHHNKYSLEQAVREMIIWGVMNGCITKFDPARVAGKERG